MILSLIIAEPAGVFKLSSYSEIPTSSYTSQRTLMLLASLGRQKQKLVGSYGNKELRLNFG